MTAYGVKPVCNFKHEFKYTFLAGAYSPFTGDHFEMELSECNSAMFQLFLDEFSEFKPHEFKIMLLDNGAFHKAKCLKIPHNIAMIFLPPYSPELNPSEKIWQRFKRNFTGKLFNDLSKLSIFLEEQVKELTKQLVKSTCSYEYLFSCDYWTNIY